MHERRWIKFVAIGALAAVVIGTWQSGLADGLDRDTLQRWAIEAGWWGPLAFIGLFAVGEVLHVPSVIFVVVAGVVWPTAIALPTAYAGGMVASALVFVVARYLVSGTVQNAVRARMPEELKRYDEALEHKGIRTVAAIRFFTFMSPLMHWVLATSRVRFGDMMIGTAIGLVPGITALVIAGDAAVRYWDIARPWVLGGVALLIVVRVAMGIRKRRQTTS